jgi:hypothetical protein
LAERLPYWACTNPSKIIFRPMSDEFVAPTSHTLFRDRCVQSVSFLQCADAGSDSGASVTVSNEQLKSEYRNKSCMQWNDMHTRSFQLCSEAFGQASFVLDHVLALSSCATWARLCNCANPILVWPIVYAWSSSPKLNTVDPASIKSFGLIGRTDTHAIRIAA